MNSTVQLTLRPARLSRLIKWPLFCLCLAVLWCRPAAAADAYYINNSILTYPGTVQYPPMIDATNFINTSIFTIDYETPTVGSELYETSDTLNYTNTGVMTCNTGFQFDTQSSSTGARTMAASFDNQNTVSCGVVTTNFLTEIAEAFGYDQCVVNATNVLNPGTLEVGEDGLLQITGQNVNLYQAKLSIQPGVTGGEGDFYLFTNWDASIYLGANFAVTPPFNIPPRQLALFGSAAYTNLVVQGSNTIYRAVFIQDTSPNVSVNVFFGPPPPQLGNGDVTVQWSGSYLDSATGNTFSNYLYLNDDYVTGMQTNMAQYLPGTTANFTLFSSSASLFGPTAATIAPVINFYPAGSFSNYYDAANFSLGLSVSTNEVANHSITNLPGRIQITGNNFLNLQRAKISGANYMSIQSTNQFEGADGALIQTPYADLNLGVTNGFLTVSNVMQGYLPIFGGTVVAWSTRWTVPDPVNIGMTYDYRVLIISSDVSPTLLSQVQNLILHGTDSTVISDTFNIMRTFNADAQSLTLTTNPVGNGATSLDGELNLEPAGILWQSSFPNLRFLTNNGAIRTANLAYFSYPTVTNFTSVLASGTLSETANGTNAVRKDKVTVGTNQYMFVATLTNYVANQVAIVPGSFDSTMDNLIAAIDAGGAGGAGVGYSTATTANPQAVAGALSNHAFTVTARASGTNGNSVLTSFTSATSSVNLSWGGHAKLYGGVPISTNVLPFFYNTALINNGIFMDQGSIIYAGNFESGGIFSNGVGSFTLQSLTTTLTNGSLSAGGDVFITADTLMTSNLNLQAGGSLTLQATNELTDTGVTNDNVWAVGSATGSGFNLPIKPASGDLLGTTITLSAPEDLTVANLWAGTDRGLSPAGYTNNEAVGQMIFDVAGSAQASQFGVLSFTGAGVSNALYVDLLVLTNFATQGNATNNYNFPWLQINTNLFIYYAQALANGESVAEVIDNQSKLGANGGRLRWISSYAGYYSSTNLVYTNAYGTVFTNTVNAALAESTDIDSDSDGTPNASDPTKFFLPSELNFGATVTNLPPRSVKVQWTTIPNATNYVYYTTNLLGTNSWLPLTNFNNWHYGNNVAVPNAAHANSFLSPQVYINLRGLPDNSQQTNVWLYDPIADVPHYYKVVVWPWLDFQPNN